MIRITKDGRMMRHVKGEEKFVVGFGWETLRKNTTSNIYD